MIATGTSRNQQMTATWNGRLLCSSIDPQQEAKQWATKHAARVRGLKHIFVLGVGCGYHLAALQKELPESKIFAIDTQAELIDIARRENGLETHDIQFVHAADLEKLLRNTKVQKALRTDYSVLKFAPALITNEVLYQRFTDILLGRDDQGFHFILAQRPELQEAFFAERVQARDGLISIKTIEAALKPATSNAVNLMVKALRELVN